MSFRLRGLILFEHKGIESAKMGSALPKGMKKVSEVLGSTVPMFKGSGFKVLLDSFYWSDLFDWFS
jgi:hypothetical protein